MKMEIDEFGERLRLGENEFWSNGDNRFEVLPSGVEDAMLSDIPPGTSIKLCERVVGSSELIGRGSLDLCELASDFGDRSFKF